MRATSSGGVFLAVMAGGAALAGLGTGARAQTAFFNGGFELGPQVLLDPAAPAGWAIPGSDPEIVYRRNGDGINAYTARTGQGFVQINASGHGGFRGLTTDARNFVHNPSTGQLCVDADNDGQADGLCPGPWPFYDAPFDWNGGDIAFSMWYRVPDTLATPANPAGEIVLVKVDIKGAGNGNQNNNASYEFSVSSVDVPTTGTQWRQISGTVAIAQIHADVMCGATAGCIGGAPFYTLPPYPNRAKITVGRFTGDNNTNVGTVLIDDVSYSQLPAGGAGCNVADITGIGGPPSPPDGLLTGDDFNAFIAAFAAGCTSSNVPCSIADITGIGGPPAPPDGLITGDDFNAFIAAFSRGCP